MGRLGKGELPLARQLSVLQEVEQLKQDSVPVKHNKDVEWLIENDPNNYHAIIERLALGESLNKISRETGFQLQILRLIQKRHPESIEIRRQAIVDRMEEAILATTERLSEENDRISVNRLAEVLSECVKNFQLLRGEATTRSETRSVASPEDLKRMFEALPQAKVIE